MSSVSIDYELWCILRKIRVGEDVQIKNLVSEAVREKLEEEYPSYLEEQNQDNRTEGR